MTLTHPNPPTPPPLSLSLSSLPLFVGATRGPCQGEDPHLHDVLLQAVDTGWQDPGRTGRCKSPPVSVCCLVKLLQVLSISVDLTGTGTRTCCVTCRLTYRCRRRRYPPPGTAGHLRSVALGLCASEELDEERGHLL